jgi:nucleotide-binding universal stress UspA family protein
MKDPHNRQPMNILLAVDGSEQSYEATKLLKDLPCFPECHLTAMIVIVPRLTSFNYQIDAILEKTRRELEMPGGPVIYTRKQFGANPAHTINRIADDEQVQLIVMGALGLRATLGVLLGGTAQQVVEYASCPVLIVRGEYSGIKHVLFVTDGSPYSQLAVQFLGRFHLPETATVEVCHIMPPPIEAAELSRVWASYLDPALMQYPPDLLEEVNTQLKEEQRAGEKYVSEAEAALLAAGVNVVGTVLRRGDAATEILAYAQEQKVDLIVAGSRGLSGVSGWWLGSVSRKLVHYAPCSVLIVRGEPPDAEV